MEQVYVLEQWFDSYPREYSGVVGVFLSQESAERAVVSAREADGDDYRFYRVAAVPLGVLQDAVYV